MAGEGEATRKILDGVIEERITRFTVTSARMEEEALDPKSLQDGVEQQMLRQVSTSSFALMRHKFVMLKEDGAPGTSCTR